MTDGILKDLVVALVTALVVPIVLKYFSNRGTAQQRDVLRKRIGELQQFLASTKGLPETPETVQAIQHAEEELRQAITELSRLSGPPAAGVADSPARKTARALQRAFVLYSASRRLGWIYRVVFYTAVLLVIIGGWGALLSIRAGQDTALDVALNLVLPVAVVVVLRYAAVAADRPPARHDRSRLAQWFLAYLPARGTAAAFHIAFFCSLTLALIEIAFILRRLKPPTVDSEDIAPLVATILLALVIRFVARGFDAPTVSAVSATAAGGTIVKPSLPAISRRQLFLGWAGGTAAIAALFAQAMRRRPADPPKPGVQPGPPVGVRRVVPHTSHSARARRHRARARPVWRDTSLVANVGPANQARPAVIHWPHPRLFKCRYTIAESHQRKNRPDRYRDFEKELGGNPRLNRGQAGTILEWLALGELTAGTNAARLTATSDQTPGALLDGPALDRSLALLDEAKKAGVATRRTYELASVLFCFRYADAPEQARRAIEAFSGYSPGAAASKVPPAVRSVLGNAGAFAPWHRATLDARPHGYARKLFSRIQAAAALHPR